MTDNNLQEIRKDIERMQSTYGTLEFITLTAASELIAHIDNQDKLLAKGAGIMTALQEFANYNEPGYEEYFEMSEEWIQEVTSE